MSEDTYRLINVAANVGTLVVLIALLGVVLVLMRERARQQASMQRVADSARAMTEGMIDVRHRD